MLLNETQIRTRLERIEKKPLAHLHTTAQLRLQRVILNADGSEAFRSPWSKNLILDAGLDDVVLGSWASMTTFSHIGTGTNPFQRDSGTTTISVTSLVATASVGFFEAGDVGRLLKLDSGEEYYIAAPFISTTQVNLVAGPDAAASEGTVWYVNRTTLQTELKRTATVRTSSGDNGRSYDGALRRFTYRRTHLHTAEVGAVTYQELGWSRANDPSLFSGLVLSGGGDSLVAGQQYMVISELIVTPSPTVTTTAPNVATGGWDSEGDACIETYTASGVGEMFSTLNASGGAASASATMECNSSVFDKGISGFINDFTLTSPMSAVPVNFPAGTVTKSPSVSTYSPGNFFLDYSAVFTVSELNADWRGCGLSHPAGSRVFSVRFDTNQTKDNVHTVTVTVRFSWGRTLIN